MTTKTPDDDEPTETTTKEETTTTTTTISQLVHAQLNTVLDPHIDPLQKIQTVQLLSRLCHEPADAYITLNSGNTSHCLLPELAHWNGQFRKAYTFLVWMRPKVLSTVNPKQKEQQKEQEASDLPRILYRFANKADDSGIGITVSCSEWQYNDTKSQVSTTLTAHSFTRRIATYNTWSQQQLILTLNEWNLLSITHIFPYLKPPKWHVCVNGQSMSSTNNELQFPILPEHRGMTHCHCLSNLTVGGAAISQIPSDNTNTKTNNTTMDATTLSASQLSRQEQQQAAVPFSMDIAGLALYKDYIPPTILAILSVGGPCSGQQQFGHLVTRLFAVPNWSKGCSLSSGPKVGTPLSVHGTALELQRLSESIVVGWSATVMDVLGGGNDKNDSQNSHLRLSCPFVPLPGLTASTPRVGLVQPQPIRGHSNDNTDNIDDDHPASVYITGTNISVYNGVSDFLLHTSKDDATVLLEQETTTTTNNWSLLWTEQGGASHCVLPLFLATSMQYSAPRLQTNSLRHLWHLYSGRGQTNLCASLITLIARFIVSGGARLHEVVLQDGLLHILSATLRLGLVRCHKLKLFKEKSLDSFLARTRAVEETVSSAVCPSHVPSAIAEAVCELLDACCGPNAEQLEDLSPHLQIRRTSDLALTATFGLALDFDLWGGDVKAAAVVLESISHKYGGSCLTTGFVLRSQMSVQHLLDRIRICRFEKSPALESVAASLSRILHAMLLSSFSNQRSITQAEKDVSACVSALCDTSLGSLTPHVVLSALVGVLTWCEILPVEATLYRYESNVSEEHKVEVASRLGRNLLIAQFHDVVVPMLLSRTVFNADKSMSSHKPIATETATGSLGWQYHWRLSLLLFSWVASIAGPEGLVAAKSTGSLLLASSLAGSLYSALEDANEVVVSTLFMPSPAMALFIGASLRNEWSYKDLIADRLRIMMPLLPGMVVSLLNHPSSPKEKRDLSLNSLRVLSHMLTAVGGAFHRVFGGVRHSAGVRQSVRTRDEGTADSIKAAKSYLPHFVVICMALENQIQRHSTETGGETVSILRAPSGDADDKTRRNNKSDPDSWVDVATSSMEDLVGEIMLTVPETESGELDSESLVSFLRSCQKSIMSTTCGLLVNAMSLGGPGVAVPLLNALLSTLQESVVYSAMEMSQEAAKLDDADRKEAQIVVDTELTKKSDGKWIDRLAMNVLCRILSLLLLKSLQRERKWEVWSFELSAAVAKVCALVEERGVLSKPLNESEPTAPTYTADQIVLICVLLDILAYGRDASGWCQLALPSMNAGTEKNAKETLSETDANSKLLLPVLRPCLRVILGCVEHITLQSSILVPGSTVEGEDVPCKEESLLSRLLPELDFSLTAAIVGLAFASARDTALYALALLRKCIKRYEEVGDLESAKLCKLLLIKVAEELRARYESERRLRDTALFDAYENGASKSSKQNAAKGSLAVERLIMGGGFVGDSGEEIVFSTSPEDKTSKKPHEDFVFFHENADGVGSTLGFAFLQGLGSALEEWKNSSGDDSDSTFARASDSLSTFLDAWDSHMEKDSSDMELVALFDTKATLDSPQRSVSSQVPILGSENAADAMTAFFELAASEKSRLKEISMRFLPGLRFSKTAFAERFCWARYAELASVDVEDVWERAVPDGNRDIRSKLPTVPCSPQFEKYLPSFMDNSSNEHVPTSPVLDSPSNHSKSDVRTSLTPAEMGELTKTLVATGNLEIVDITKKQADDDLPMDTDAIIEGKGEAFDDEIGNFDSAVDEEDAVYGTTDHHDGDSGSDDLNASGNLSIGDDEGEYTGKSHVGMTTSSFATPPDNSSSSLGLMHSAAAGMIQQHLNNCTHVRPEGNRQCTVLLTSSHLILEYDGDADGFFDGELLAKQEEADRQKRIAEDTGGWKEPNSDVMQQQKDEKRQRAIAASRPKSIRWNLSEISHVYLRRYRLRDSSLEVFFIPTGGTAFGGFGLYAPSCSLFLDFGAGHTGKEHRDEAAFAIMRKAPPQAICQWPDRANQFLQEQLGRLTMGWVEGRITNFDYLLHMNILSGRSYNDICQYPVFPWVLADYTSEEIPDLNDRNSYRDLSKPVGALNPDRLKDFLDRFNTFADPSGAIPPFMYGSHYSTSAGVVLHFLVRLHPFAGLHRQLQSGHFDVADRLFSSIPRTWAMCTGTSAAEVKEITPEWYCNPAFLRNDNSFKLGTSQDGEVIDDVVLPPWARGSPEKFVEVMRAALESDICSEMLSDWIDLIFGHKQRGPESVKANNVFFYLTYYGTVDVANIEDESLRQATELQIAHFGQCPMQLFKRPHVRRLPENHFKLSLYQLLSTHGQRGHAKSTKLIEKTVDTMKSPSSDRARLHSVFGEPLFLPFFAAPLSHWVHSNAPPPGPHAPLVAVRFAGTERCLAVDSRGVYHYFRWAWRADEMPKDNSVARGFFDQGCFVAQRELPRFRTVPRLMFAPRTETNIAVAISKTLFANRTVLLVISDGDGAGSLGMQLVDPTKGDIKGEVMIPQAHSAKITCITTDPIGTAAGHGGVGGELALVGSADGNASLWRFMSSHFLPLRPRVRLQGHFGSPIYAVSLCSAINVAATISSNKCCLHAIGNGTLIRSFGPPSDTIELQDREDLKLVTKFAKTPALALSVQGFIVTVCETTIQSESGSDRNVITLHLFTIEGVSIGSKPLESWRGLPHKMHCTPDGTTVMVCCGRGVTFHRLSACQPLEFLDEFQVTESDDFGSAPSCTAWDVDLGPALNRPVVAAAACSEGALRLHALPGISEWSERHKKSGLSQAVGTALKTPARKLKTAVKDGLSFGQKFAGMGRDLQKEVSSDVKEKGVGGFLGNVMSSFRKDKFNK